MSSADRMLSVLQLFSMDRTEWTVDLAAEKLGCSLSTTYRYFASLARAGLISPIGGSRLGRYILGPAAVEMDWLIRRTDPLTRAGRQPLRTLAGSLDRPALLLLCRLYHGQVMCVTQEAVGFPSFATAYERGRPMPLFRGAASKVILAHLPDRAIRAFIRDRAAELAEAGLPTHLAELKALLAPIRRAGHCETAGELDFGLTGLAAPVFDGDGVIGSIGYAFASETLNPDAVARFAQHARAAAAHVSSTLVDEATESQAADAPAR